MSRVFKNHLEGLSALHRGVRALASTAATTLGPQGTHIIIKKERSHPYITKHGASIAKELQLSDAFENIGLKLAREVAIQTDRHVGDGSTTAMVFTEALFALGLQGIACGFDPLEIKQGIMIAGDKALEELKKLAISLQSSQDVVAVATTAANNDPVLGQLAADVIASIGIEGEYSIEKSPTSQTLVHTYTCLELHSGYLSSYFITHPETMEVIYEHAYVLLCNQALSCLNQDFICFLEKIAQMRKLPLIIIAAHIDPQLLSVLIVNKLKGSFPLCAIQISEQGEICRQILEDIAVVTGATLIDSFAGVSFETADVNVLGKVEKAYISESKAVFSHGAGEQDRIANHMAYVQGELSHSPSQEVFAILENRLSRVSGKKVRVDLGATTEEEFQEKKIYLLHALQAIKSAYREGYLPGGGVALIRAAERIQVPEDVSPGVAYGYTCLQQSVRAPLAAIITNCGGIPSAFLDVLANHPDPYFGYNGITNAMENMISSGIYDAFSMIKFVLKHSISIACLLLTSSLFIVGSSEKIEDRFLGDASSQEEK